MKHISKNDFMAVVGFYGHTAIVDKKLRATIKKLSLEELLTQGYYKEAVSGAVYSGNEEEKAKIIEFFRQKQHVESFDSLEREFGVYGELNNIKKIKKL